MRTPALSVTCCDSARTELPAATHRPVPRHTTLVNVRKGTSRAEAVYYRFDVPHASIRADSTPCKHLLLMTDPTSDAPAPTSQFRRTLIKVMSMQLFTLLVLALIQLRYS